MISVDEVRSFVSRRFAESVELPEAEVLSPEATLATVIARSSKLTNSLDLMEAFARTANALRKEHGVRVTLPAFPLDTPTSTVLDAFVAQVEAKRRVA